MYSYITFILLLIFNFFLLSRGDDCQILLDKFAYSISNFTYCSLTHARPISMCGNCVNHTILMLENHENLIKTSINGTACINDYINLDRLQVVQSIYKSSMDLWHRARCNECFLFVNGSLTYHPSKVKEDFNLLFETFKNCTDRNQKKNQTEICTNCMDTYIELNAYYFSIGDLTHGGISKICMDVVDLMNGTELDWSINCCKYRIKSEFIYVVTTIFMIFIPIVFYILVKLLVDVKRPILSPQNRFAESMNTPSTSFRNEST